MYLKDNFHILKFFMLDYQVKNWKFGSLSPSLRSSVHVKNNKYMNNNCSWLQHACSNVHAAVIATGVLQSLWRCAILTAQCVRTDNLTIEGGIDHVVQSVVTGPAANWWHCRAAGVAMMQSTQGSDGLHLLAAAGSEPILGRRISLPSQQDKVVL